jgi:hypothetical protein
MKIYDDRQLKLPLRFPPSMATLERTTAPTGRVRRAASTRCPRCVTVQSIEDGDAGGAAHHGLDVERENAPLRGPAGDAAGAGEAASMKSPDEKPGLVNMSAAVCCTRPKRTSVKVRNGPTPGLPAPPTLVAPIPYPSQIRK